MKMTTLIKSFEAMAMIGLPVAGYFFGGVTLVWAILIVACYVVLNITGLGAKTVNPDPDKPAPTVNPDPDKPKKRK